jgi:diaminohydroxyphosphoribosylaminopyrimidine deaminase / 5-amino-6-(5-phosphoribosylamino)uracil reductase
MNTDTQWMQQALTLAEQALYLTSPNPRVGCVLVKDGQRIGQGHTQAAGSAHAEVMALRDATQRGHDVRGATAFVTLEPCNHQGRTGPCSEALVRAGVSRVVAAIEDPNPLVAGQGLTRLQAAGIEVSCGVLAEQAREINIGFFKRMTQGRPWVRMKTAVSLDGQTALQNGVSQWITGQAARNDGHHWRARACAVLTGIGTILEDDPQLNVRAVATPRQPTLVVIDSQLQTPPKAKLFAIERPIWLYGATSDAQTNKDLLTQKGAHIRILPNPSGKVDLAAMLDDLGQRGINELHVEAGHKLHGSFLREGLVNELLVYMAPKLLGQGQGMTNLGPFQSLEQAHPFTFHEVSPVGQDLRLRLYRA